MLRIRRDIVAVTDQWISVQSGVTPQEREAAETSLKTANEASERWRSITAQQMESLFSEITVLFSDLPSPSSTRPGHARAVALQVVSTELKRCGAVLSRDTEDTKQLSSLNEDVARARSRVAVLEEQIAKPYSHPLWPRKRRLGTLARPTVHNRPRRSYRLAKPFLTELLDNKSVS